jgi:hypothetical protein
MVSHVGVDVYRYVRSTVSVITVNITLQLSNPSSALEVTFLKSTAFDSIHFHKVVTQNVRYTNIVYAAAFIIIRDTADKTDQKCDIETTLKYGKVGRTR